MYQTQRQKIVDKRHTGSSEQSSCPMMPEVDQSKSYMIDPCNPNTQLMDVFNVSTDTIAKGLACLVVHCQNRIEWVAEQMVMLVHTRRKNGYRKQKKPLKKCSFTDVGKTYRFVSKRSCENISGIPLPMPL
jgi:hypothetical protein